MMALADTAALQAVRDWCRALFSTMYRPGDSVTVAVDTAGFLTSSSTNVRFLVPLAHPVASTVTEVSVSSMTCILRQGGKYTHGSSANATVTPASVTAWATKGAGNYLVVWATMSATTNAVNNDTIGINATLTVTFS